MSDYFKPVVNKVLALDEIEPPYDQPEKCPKSLTKTRRVDGVLYVAGKPPAKYEHTEEVQSDIMFVTTAVEEEEAQEMSTSSYGVTIKQKADYLRGPAGNLFKEVCGRSGIFPEEHYHTALVKWLLPKAKRSSPAAAVMKWGMPILLDEIARVKPKIVVCLGKKVFDMLSDKKMNFSDANGGWFWSTKANAHLYVMQSPYMMIPKPELHEMFRVDLTEISRKLDILKYGTINELPVNIEVIDNYRDLKAWQERMIEEGVVPINDEGAKVFSVDCEWHGNHHIDGQLRSIQLAWNDSDAIYVKFRNERNEWCFDMEGAPAKKPRQSPDVFCLTADGSKAPGVSPPRTGVTNLGDWGRSLRLNPSFLNEWDIDQDPDFASITQAQRDELKLYRLCGGVIGKVTNPDNVHFVGHHYVADALWMDRWLGMRVLGKCYMDTEFAQQTADESSELKLERGIAMKYTTLGRYDLDLVLWKKDNKKLCEGGYGFIPDKIIIPYACLAWDSLVQLGDGSWERIHKLVDQRYDGTVRALVDGEIKECRVTNWKKSRKPGQKWLRLVMPSTKRVGKFWTGPRFTEDHKILTNEGYARVDKLDVTRHKIATSDLAPTHEQRQLLLGSLLGDGGLFQPNDAGVLFRTSQSGDGQPYAQWKATSLSGLFPMRRKHTTYDDNRNDSLAFESPVHVAMSNLSREFTRSSSRRGHFAITEKLLTAAGDLGLAVWVMDDGTRVDNTLRLCRRSASEEEVEAGLAYFRKQFGKYVTYHRSNGVFIFSHGSYWRLMDRIKPFMHPAKAQKHAEGEDVKTSYPVDQTPNGVEYEPILEVVPADRPQGNAKMECFRYCLTVPEAGNFLTKAGFVSNCKDVLAVYRGVPFIRKLLNAQRLWEYYRDTFNPFVTDVFFTFAQTGLPMDIPLMDELRELFNWSQRELNAEFKVKITQDAKHRLVGKCIELLGPEKGIFAGIQTVNMVVNGDIEQGWNELKAILPLDKFNETRPFLDHLAGAPTFNLRAPDQMRQWLYAVSGMTPIKTTNQKAKGMPSMDWQKVLELPADKQKLYTPSVDKQTLMILDSQLPLVSDLLDLNVVGNLCKAFLKEPEEYYDEELDEVVIEEAGLHQWLASDATIRGQTSCTETGRPRGWRPNSLNWPSYVNKRIGKVMARIIQQHVAAGTLPDTLRQWSHVKDEKDLPSIRSVVKAITGWCLVESDYQTAEIRGMAYISGDRNLMRLMNDPDPEWAFTKDGYKVRVAYTDFKMSGIPTNKQHPDYIMKRMEGGKVIAEYTDADLIRNEQTGEVVHCRYDLHWSIAEWTYEMPREEMLEKVHRAAGKVLNFSCLSATTELYTNEGPVAIRDIKNRHKLWDGQEWVRHAGTQYQGRRQVIRYAGICATPEHVVWDAAGTPVTLIDAAYTRRRLSGGAVGTTMQLRLEPRAVGADAERCALERRVQAMRRASMEMASQCEEHGRGSLPLVRGGVGSLQGQEGQYVRSSLPRHAAALRHLDPCLQPQLQGQGDSGEVQTPRVHPMGTIDLAGRDVPEQGLRPDRQQRALQLREPTAGVPVGESEEHTTLRGNLGVAGPHFHGRASGIPDDTAPRVEPPAARLHLEGDRVEGRVEHATEPHQEGAPREAGESQQQSGRVLQELPGREAAARLRGEAAEAGSEQGADTSRRSLGLWYRLAGITPPDCGDSGLLSIPGLFQGLRRGATDQGLDAGANAGTPSQHRYEYASQGAAMGRELPGHLQCPDLLSHAEGREDGASDLAEVAEEIPVVDVYDIINAGPRKRFALACGGVIVSNSAYGASPGSLERKIESDTGVKPAEGTGQKGLDAIAARQPRATEFLEEMQSTPAMKGWYRAASGRIRHCVMHDRNSGVGYRQRNSIESATGRELRNFPMQESVASTAARAGKWLGEFYRNAGMKARVITILYDSVVTMCPLEEREVVAHLHQQFMCDANNWVYQDDQGFRELLYPIDTDFNYRWSTKPSKAEKALLEDMTWHPTPARMQWMLGFVAPKATPIPLAA